MLCDLCTIAELLERNGRFVHNAGHCPEMPPDRQEKHPLSLQLPFAPHGRPAIRTLSICRRTP